MTTALKKRITKDQLWLLAMAIVQNEGPQGKALRDLSDSALASYLVDAGYEDSPANIAKLRNA